MPSISLKRLCSGTTLESIGSFGFPMMADLQGDFDHEHNDHHFHQEDDHCHDPMGEDNRELKRT
jgi:hypothetical protein